VAVANTTAMITTAVNSFEHAPQGGKGKRVIRFGQKM